MKNAILYTRVSSDRQVEEGNSLVTQAVQAAEFAKKHDLTITKTFEERGESAKTANRTALKEMLAYASMHKGEVDVLIVYKRDRLARDALDGLMIELTLMQVGVETMSMTEGNDNTPIGRLMKLLSYGTAQYENEIRGERSKQGMLQAVVEGRWVWMAPLGFVNTRVNGKKNVAPDPDDEYTAILRTAWTLIANGHTLEDARKILNLEMAKIGRKPIRFQTFSRMIRNKLYVGVVKAFGLEIQSMQIKPFVDPDLFNQVQDIIAGNKNKGNKYIKTNPRYPLRGILWCKNGHKMTASAPRGRGGTYPKYHCPKCRGQGTSYDVSDVEAKFIDYAQGMSINNDIKEALKEAIRLNLDDTSKRNQDEQNRLNKRAISISAEKKELTRKNLSGVIPDATAQELLSDYEKEERDIRKQLANLTINTDDTDEIMAFGLTKLNNVAQTIQGIDDIGIRTRFQKWLFPAGLTYDGEKFGTTQIPLIYRLKQSTLVGALPNYSHVVIPRRIELRLPG